MALRPAQNLAGVGDVVSVLEFRIADVDRAEQMAAKLARSGDGYVDDDLDGRKPRAVSRAAAGETGHRAFYRLITFVAGLNILVVLAMTVSDRAQRYSRADGHGREAPSRCGASL
jgi:ABC-type lipoprotein release transport system permease subunit